jgi:hypothetical protein
MELSNMFEKLSMTAGNKINPLKSPITAFDEGDPLSQKNQNRNFTGALGGPTVGLIEDVAQVAGVPVAVAAGDDVIQAKANAAERLVPFNSYIGMRQMLRHVINPRDN